MVADYELRGKLYPRDPGGAMHQHASSAQPYIYFYVLPESIVLKLSLKNAAMFSLLTSATGYVMCLMLA